MADEPKPPENLAALMTPLLGGWVHATGLRLLSASSEEVTAEWDVGPEHLQAYGVVHGGVHAGVIETIASVGAGVTALPRGQNVVGLENHTSFIRAVRGGRLRATARPLTRGRRTQLWEANITDEEGRLVASGRVRLLCLEQEAALGGAAVELPSGGQPR